MDKRLYVELPPFTGRNVPITEIAKAIGKDAHYVRIGIQQGILKFGVAMKMGDSNEFSYYCSDRKVWEETGYFNEEAKKQGKEKKQCRKDMTDWESDQCGAQDRVSLRSHK